jgi:hypothetical protein
MRVLMIGDVVGKTGRRMIAEHVRRLRTAHHIDLVVANGENAAGGNGLTHDVLDELLSAGVDVLTSGNHIFDKREIFEFIDDVHRRRCHFVVEVALHLDASLSSRRHGGE